MWQVVANVIRKLDTLKYLQEIERALALNRRAEVRRDGLKLSKVSSSLEIEWYARDIHPWDRHDQPERRATLFVRQCLDDTDAAITRLFEALPQVDVIAVRVLERTTEEIILAGIVHRSSAAPDSALSAGMRLWQRGIMYHSDGWQFEPLESNEDSWRRQSYLPDRDLVANPVTSRTNIPDSLKQR